MKHGSAPDDDAISDDRSNIRSEIPSSAGGYSITVS